MCLLVPGSRVVLFRRTFPDLQRAVVDYFRAEMPVGVAAYNVAEHMWRFTNGSVLELAHLELDSDIYKYQGAEYALCVERTTPVLMADRTWKPINQISAGDWVTTLQGPRPVTQVHHMGTKPAARVTTLHGSAVVSMQHPLLAPQGWVAPQELISTGCHDDLGSSASSAESCSSGLLPAGYSSQDLQPKPQLAGRPHRDTALLEIPVWSVDARSGSAAFRDSPQASQRPPAWCGPLVLFGLDHQSVDHAHTSRDGGETCGPGGWSAPGFADDCRSSPRLDGERSLQSSAGDRTSSPSRGDVGGHSPACCCSDDRASIRGHSRADRIEYDHPYTKERVTSTEVVHQGEARIVPAGAAELMDLTVAGASHYVASGNLIARNCIFEELTQFTERQYKYLMSRLRVSGAVRARMAELGWRPRMVSTSNPGGVGHQFVKARFIDPAPPETRFTPQPTVDDPNPLTRIFIPAKVADNPSIDQDAYNRTLAALDPGLRRALRDGDWNVLEGVRFGQWRNAIHVVEPGELDVPLVDYPRCVGVDWGMSAPFAAVWLALLPDGLVYVYRELYQAGLTSQEQCALILASEQEGERIPTRALPLVLDPSMWARTHITPGKDLDPRRDYAPLGSIARTYQDAFGRGSVHKANNARVNGWALIDEHLRVRGDGLPRLLVSSTCRNLIRTLPSVPRSRANPDDLDTASDDHLLDALRYALQYLAGGGVRRVTSLPEGPVERPITAGLATAQF